MGRIVWDLLRKPRESHASRYLGWDATIDDPKLFRLYRDSCQNVIRPTLKQWQPNNTIGPLTFLSQLTSPNECNWSILELEADVIHSVGNQGLEAILFQNYHFDCRRLPGSRQLGQGWRASPTRSTLKWGS